MNGSKTFQAPVPPDPDGWRSHSSPGPGTQDPLESEPPLPAPRPPPPLPFPPPLPPFPPRPPRARVQAERKHLHVSRRCRPPVSAASSRRWWGSSPSKLPPPNHTSPSADPRRSRRNLSDWHARADLRKAHRDTGTPGGNILNCNYTGTPGHRTYEKYTGTPGCPILTKQESQLQCRESQM